MATADMGPRQLCGVVDPPFTARQSRSRDVTDTAGPVRGGQLARYGRFPRILLGRNLVDHRDLVRRGPQVIRTEPAPRRPFQGWRYLDPKDSPRDLPKGRTKDDPLPPALAQALAEIGLR